MSLFRRLISRNLKIPTIPSNIVSSRYCSSISGLQQKIPKISEQTNTLELIDNYDSTTYCKKSNHNQKVIQRYGSKRKAKLDQMVLEDKDQYHPVLYSLLSAKTGLEIMNLLSNININDYSSDEIIGKDYEKPDEIEEYKNLNPSIHRIYCKAMRCCADLNDFKTCYDIYELCKNNNIISCELYCTMMWCLMYEKRTTTSLEKVFKLYNELKETNIPISPRLYSTLINSCIKVADVAKGNLIYKEIQGNTDLLYSQRVFQAVCRLLNRNGQIDQVINIMDDRDKYYQDKNIDGYISIWSDYSEPTISELLYTCGRHIFGGFAIQYIEKAEKIFKKSLMAACKYNINIPTKIFNGMIYAYANNGDWNSCNYILNKCMIDKNKNKCFPKPTSKTFEELFRCLLNAQDIDNDDKWKKVDTLFKQMDKLKINPIIGIYYELFELCVDDIEKVQKYYNEMINVHNLTPNMSLLTIMMDTGSKYFKKEENKNKVNECKEFVEFVISQYDIYDILPTENIKSQWRLPPLISLVCDFVPPKWL